jgi:hypothetical protein
LPFPVLVTGALPLAATLPPAVRAVLDTDAAKALRPWVAANSASGIGVVGGFCGVTVAVALLVLFAALVGFFVV